MYVRVKTRHLVGNFQYSEYWSDEANEFMENRQLFYFVDKGKNTLANDFVDSVREYYRRHGAYDLQAVNLALSLLSDVYYPDVMPLEICKKMKNKAIAKQLSDELFILLEEYGNMDIVYHDKDTEIRNSCRLNNRLFLTKNSGVGMPVDMFLIWAKGGVRVPSRIMKEWSGIPRPKVAEVYTELVDEFRYFINEKRSWEWQTETMPEFESVNCF